MKNKILFIILSFFIILMFSAKTNASSVGGDYQKFSSITLCRGKLINNYTEEELAPYKSQTKKRMWNGWRIAYINKRVKCNFVSETIMSVYNTGTSAMKYKLQKVDSTVYKTSVSATGNIGTNVKGTVKKFTGGLESSLKIENQTSTTIEVKTTENMEIDIDPQTKVTMYLCGDGYLTNGYAKKYEWWVAANWGCFEYFEITNIYPRIVKVSI